MQFVTELRKLFSVEFFFMCAAKVKMLLFIN